MADLPPSLPTQYQLYNTYVLDPPWQVHYTTAWAGAAALFTILSLRKLWRAIQRGHTWQSVKGIAYHLDSSAATRPSVIREVLEENLLVEDGKKRIVPPNDGLISRTVSSIQSTLLWSPPGFNLDAGQLIILAGYAFTLCFCIIFKAPLKDNPNRAGFMTLAQLPFVFLFAAKNSIMSLLWLKGYERLNFLHRWAGRGVFLSATIHGAFWIQNHLVYNVPIIGAYKERMGVLSYLFLGLIVITSLRPIRRLSYQFFFYSHVVTFVAFFVLINYHTPFSTPWIYPPLVFYGLDLLLRLFRYRIREASLIAPDNQMTFIRVHDCGNGWNAGQHVRLRAFFSGRAFESHPLTIINAPYHVSCSSTNTLLLGTKANGDWSKALNNFTRSMPDTSPIAVMLDGPYGGCSFHLGDYENVFLVAGGSGITFTLSLLDDVVGRVVRHGRQQGELTRRIEFVWCIRSFGNIHWFAPMLADIANFASNSSIDLHITVFVTCLCDPRSVPVIANCDVFEQKPSIPKLLGTFLAQDLESGKKVRATGGLAVATSGPNSLTRETRNAVAGISVAEKRKLGNIAVHTEAFSI